MNRSSFLIIVILLFACNIIMQAQVTVTGRVTDLFTNDPLPGVTVYQQGIIQTGTVTDHDGNYSITVSADATLIFTFIGYNAVSIPVQDRTRIDVQMEEVAAEIDEVVVVGIAMRRSELTGAVGTITSERLNEKPVTTINTALQGRVAGVHVSGDPRPGEDPSINIRGRNSIQYGTNPIYVVDGIVMTNGFNMVNVNDVASIDILKDASATALYGSRGANGVVVITTKKGTRGGRISYDGWAGWERFSNELPRMKAHEIYDLRIDAYANYYMDQNPGADRQAYVNTIRSRGPDAIFQPYEFDALERGHSYDWIPEVTRGGFQQNHALSFSGANDTGNYFVSFGYHQQEGLVKNSDNTRYTGRVNLEQQVRPWLRVGTNTSFSRLKTNIADSSVWGQAFGANPMLAPNDDRPTIGWGSNFQNSSHNPIMLLDVDDVRYQNRIFTTNFITIMPVSSINLRAAYSLDYRNQKQFVYYPKEGPHSLQNNLDGHARHQRNEWLNWQLDISATYNKIFAQRHRLTAYVAFNASENNEEWTAARAQNMPTDEFTYFYLNPALLSPTGFPQSDFQSSALAAFMQRINYSYANKYYATLTFRQEGSSRIAEDHRWGFFPALALRWVVSEESFLQNIDVIDQLSLRGGYGIVGNQNIPLYAYMTLYRANVSGGQVSYQSTGRLGNPNLKWEQQKQLNFGLDMTLFNNRLSLTADYFNINNDELLMRRTLSPMTGFSESIANVGAMTNKGFEVTANVSLISNSDFNWNVSANISHTKNVVTKLFEGVDAVWSVGGWNQADIQRTGNLFVGESVNNIFVYKFDKILQESDMDRISGMNTNRVLRPGDIMVVDLFEDGELDHRDRHVVGSTDPKFFGGFSTDLNYRGIGLNLIFTYSQGLKRLSGQYEGMVNSSGMSVAHTDLLNRWTPQNTNSNIPRAYSGGGRFSFGETDWGVQDASFLRLSVITLSYDLPKNLISRIGLANAQVYLTGNNVFCITNFKGYDPEGRDDYPTYQMLVTGIRFDF